MADDFRAEVLSLGEFFTNSNRPLIIPELQRSFEWGAREIDILWKDIQFHQSSVNLEDIFLGTLIVFSDSNRDDQSIPFQLEGEEKINKWLEKLDLGNTGDDQGNIEAINKKRARSELLDGQQRLTTLLIGMKILAGYCKLRRLSDEKAALESCLRYYDRIRLEHQVWEEQKDFENIIKNHGKNTIDENWADSEEKDEKKFSPMRKAYLRCKEILEKICTGGGCTARTRELAAFMQCNIKFCLLDCQSEEQKHLVFAAVNHAGIKLHKYQLFKSKIFHQAAMVETEANYTEVRAIWRQMSTALYTSNQMKVGDFLFDWARSRNYCQKNEDGGYEKFLSEDLWYDVLRDEVLDGCENPGDVLTLMRNINEDAALYIKIRRPDNTLGDAIWHDLADFNSIYPQGGLRPVLLSILNLENNEQINCIQLLRLCTAYIVIPGYQGRASFAKETRENWVPLILEGNIAELKTIVRAYFLKIDAYLPPKGAKPAKKKEVISGAWKHKMLNTGLGKGGGGQAAAKFLLRCIEGLGPKEDSTPFSGAYNTKFLQAEHIFPKSTPWQGNSISQWKREEDSNPGLWPENEDDRNALKFLLGNFIILEDSVNDSAKARSWRGAGAHPLAQPKWKMTTKKPKRAIKYPVKGSDIEIKKLSPINGKSHVFRHYEWVHEGILLKGSQLQAVHTFVEEHRLEKHWSQELLEKRAEKLLNKAIDSECKLLRLSVLW